jgi:hypothetical protein
MAVHAVTLQLEYGGGVVDHTAELLNSYGVHITRGAQDWVAETPPSTARFALKGWRFAPGNVGSDLFGLVGEGTPVRIIVSTDGATADTRFTGEIVQRTARHVDKRDSDDVRLVEIEAKDTTHRLARGEPLDDAVARFARLNGAIGYWPLDDPPGTTSARAVAGRPLRAQNHAGVTGSGEQHRVAIQWQAADLAPWLETAPILAHLAVADGVGTIHLSPSVSGALDTPSSPTDLAIDLALRGHTTAAPPAFSFRDDAADISVLFGSPLDDVGTLTVDLFQGFGAADESWGPFDVPQLYEVDTFHHLRIHFDDDGGDLRWRLWIDGILIASETSASFAPPRWDSFSVRSSTLVDLRGDAIVVGRIAAWSGAVPTVADTFAAYSGHAGEHAGRRIERLCSEETIPLSTLGDRDDTQPMGPQHPGTALSLLREAAATDHGILTGRQDNPGVFVRFLRNLYNQTPTLQLSRVGDPLEVLAGWQHLTNDVTVTDRQGGTANAVLLAGPGNVSDPADDPEGIGRWRGPPRAVNVASPVLLGDHAGWLLLQGTQIGQRLVRLTVDLDRNPELANAVRLTALGSRVTVDGLPPTLTPDRADTLAMGWTETIQSRRRKITYLTAPAQPHTVGEYAGATEEPDPDEPKRYSPTDSRVDAPFDAGTDTALMVEDQTGGNDLWSQTADFPFDVKARGVRLRVTAVGSPTGAVQTLTVQQTPVNGVTGVAIAAGERVELWQPARYGL